ncbi:reversion-inducing cysteine-rich protein with Kazal motifs [Plutella xylostella]|uniref:reversion-inducing cysteine-rich protein with Kazal motifs n=1 Tax=Plutella xylostella TaxID=51655 RepID=UPI0020322163|nr:reversion-inducing cysteine-rich protein with Kazal motifs [Plutella xylostella]
MGSSYVSKTTDAGDWWRAKLVVVVISLTCAYAQNISTCCVKAHGSCRSVCEKMSEAEEGSATREETLPNIYKFCTPQLVEFWICMNRTIEEVVASSDSGWWGRVCCETARAPGCRAACAAAANATALACRRSDELAFFDCVEKQEDAQRCCSQTQSLSCQAACQKVLWRLGHDHVDINAKDKAEEQCEQSPPLLQCLRDLTASTVHEDTAKYLPCCHESHNLACRSTCQSVLRHARLSRDILEGLEPACGPPSIRDNMWQCFLRQDGPRDHDVLPHDAAKMHCCYKAKTIHCKRLCFDTFNAGWLANWQQFYSSCRGDPQEHDLTQCLEEVEAPCSLGCSGLTYCSHMNQRHTELFRACTAAADLHAHLVVADQMVSGYVKLADFKLPLKNSSQCTADVWKSVACALHVKPCTAKSQSSLLCLEECLSLVSVCIDWSRARGVSARSLCARLSHDKEPCVSRHTATDFSVSPPLLSAREAVTSPCAGGPCNSSQLCLASRSGRAGPQYTCVDGCPLGGDSPYIIPVGSWARLPMPSAGKKVCYKICRCGSRGLGRCQPLPCVDLDSCKLYDKIIPHRSTYYMECNPCACYLGERICAQRACGRARLPTGLPCNCPPHHLPARTAARAYPNVCLAKCAGATDAEIEFGIRAACDGASCGRRSVCLPAPTVCLSRLQTACPQYVCVNTSSCNSQPASPVCDVDGRTHATPCHLATYGAKLAYWGPCLHGCNSKRQVCGVNGVTYTSECAAWADYASVDYYGSCQAVGPISDLMEPKCTVDQIVCPRLKAPNCLGFTAPGACCPKCGGALRILYSKKQIDRALYGTNISASVINLKNILSALERHVKIAECALRGYLTFETEFYVTVESVLQFPTDLQLTVCVLEAEKIADLINRDSAVISSDLGLSSLALALIEHKYPTSGSETVSISMFSLLLSFISIYLFC